MPQHPHGEPIPPGLYDHLVNAALHERLAGSDPRIAEFGEIDAEEAHAAIAQYLERLLASSLSTLRGKEAAERQRRLVDRVIQTLVAELGAEWSERFNLANPLRRLLELAPALGLQLRAAPFDEWRSRLAQVALQSGGDGAASFLPLLEEVTAEQVFMPAFDCSNTLQGLSATAISCPPVGPQLLETYFSYFRRKGLLAAASGGDAPSYHVNGKQREERQGDARRI